MIDLLLQLVTKGIELLKEGERQRKLFFEDVVEPSHLVFERLYEDHLKTFGRVREMFLDSQSTSQQIRSYTEGQILFQHGTTVLLRQLTTIEDDDWSRLPGGELGDRFASYVACVARCLMSERAYPSLVYYDTLQELLGALCRKEDLSPSGREHTLEVLERTVRRLHDFRAEVYKHYVGLKRFCSA